MKSSVISKAYQDIRKFNEIAGVLEAPTYDDVDLYNSLSFEELTESIDALEENDPEGILDGSVDEFVIVCGKLQILEQMGYNVAEAIDRVCKNNLDKFPSVEKGVRYSSEFTSEINEKYDVYVIKDANGKIRKHEDFVGVDLSDCVPVEGDNL